MSQSVSKPSRSVEERLLMLEDRLAIFQLEGSYCAAYDGGHGEEWAALFTEDGIYQGRRLDGMPEMNFVQGRKALAAFCNSNTLRCIHYLNLPKLTIDGDDATSRLNYRFRGYGVDKFGRVALTECEGYYDVAYRRTEEGWRIRRKFTNYFDRSEQTLYGFEATISPLETQNPPMKGDGKFKDHRLGHSQS